MSHKTNFQPLQIVCLEHLATYLYAEVIQVVESRQVCWVRPLFLVQHSTEESSVIDLRSTVDLLWSLSSFRPALDTEILPFLASVFTSTPPQQANSSYARQQLNSFIQQLWQAQKSELLDTKLFSGNGVVD